MNGDVKAHFGNPSLRLLDQQQMTPPQQDIGELGLLESGFSCILQMSTGSGKTWLAEQAMADVLSNGHRAVYLAPLRALAEELTDRWRMRFGEHVVGVFTGDYGAGRRSYPVTFSDAKILVLTPERLDSCTRAWRSHWSWIPEVDLLVVDEFHLLGEGHRGARLEGTLSRFRRLNPFVRILGLSATLGNRFELADWIDGVAYSSDWRPTPLEWRVVRYRRASDKPSLLALEVKRNIDNGGKSLVFVQSRRRAEELSRFLEGVGLRAKHHHAGLEHHQREVVEDAFRHDSIDVLVATSTLEMGLNLPVRQAILYDLQGFDGTDFRSLTTNSVWQRVGRAGRPGLDSHGEAVLMAPTWDRQVDHYSEGRFEPIRSQLGDRRFVAEQVIVETASGLTRTPIQLRSVFSQSLAARQGTLPSLNRVIGDMLDAGMIQQVDDDSSLSVNIPLRATRFGHVAARHLLSPETIALFRRSAMGTLNLTLFDLLLVATSSVDCEPMLPVDFEELECLSRQLSQERSSILPCAPSRVRELLGIDGKRLLAALKMALVARSRTRFASDTCVAESLNCYPFEVRRLRDSLERLLFAMAAVVSLSEQSVDPSPNAPPDNSPMVNKVQTLHRMVAGGLNERAVTLTLIDGIGPKIARRLVEVGITDLQTLAGSGASGVARVKGISAQRASRFVDDARVLVELDPHREIVDDGPLVELDDAHWSSDIDPYRLRRALDLTVVPMDSGRFLVTGGLEPHCVHVSGETPTCDCMDAARGITCKHVLAVAVYRGDEEVKRSVSLIRSQSSTSTFDLHQLWFQGGQMAKGRISNGPR